MTAEAEHSNRAISFASDIIDGAWDPDESWESRIYNVLYSIAWSLSGQHAELRLARQEREADPADCPSCGRHRAWLLTGCSPAMEPPDTMGGT